jgi:transposase-like protein
VRNGPACPHRGSTDRVRPLAGQAHRIGLKVCYAFRKQFTVRVGSAFENSHAPLHQRLHAAHLMGSSKKDISSNQLARILGVTAKTAWFMSHRLREAMRADSLLPPDPVGGAHVSDDASATMPVRITQTRMPSVRRVSPFGVLRQVLSTRCGHDTDDRQAKLRPGARPRPKRR